MSAACTTRGDDGATASGRGGAGEPGPGGPPRQGGRHDRADAPREEGPSTATPAAPLPLAADGRPLEEVAREHLPALLRYATTLTGDPHQAADVVQEVLVRAHSRWRRIGLLDRPDLYLRRMVTNEHLSWRRRWHVRSVRPGSDELLAAHAAPVTDHAARIADHDALAQALSTLTPRQRTALVLRYYEGLDDAEIAAVLGTSRATVRSHVSHALAALRAATGEKLQ